MKDRSLRTRCILIGAFVRLVLLGYPLFLCELGRGTITAAFSSISSFTRAQKFPRSHLCGLYSSSQRQCVDILSTSEAAKLSEKSKQRIANCLAKAGILDNDYDSNTWSSECSEELLLLARDFVDRPEAFAALLKDDFDFPVLVAHQTRALAMAAIRVEDESNGIIVTSKSIHNKEEENDFQNTAEENVDEFPTDAVPNHSVARKDNAEHRIAVTTDIKVNQSLSNDSDMEDATGTTQVKSYNDKEFRSTIVNEQAKRRKRSGDDYNYGLPKDYATTYPKLAKELDDFYIFMTQPSTYSQESPIRDATAKVYMLHAKLFLGWCSQKAKTDKNMSIFAVLPDKRKESADNIIQFILWMRTRDISVSYEANLLRGIIKLLKFRFSRESTSDRLDGKNTFDDIPIIKEIRKLHRDANQRQRLAPRSSDESKKWITWQEYLGVVKNLKNELIELIQNYEGMAPSERRYAKGDTDRLYSLEQTRVAEAYQRYLILAILASIPDRQRTIRELEVGRTLLKDAETGCWVVKHGPGDYKTGKAYGERPAMQLAEELTPAIDDFLERWRPSLKPITNVLLVQSRTGKPMTGDSVFQRVTRCCFKYTGKRVNPHLLRDIIVTHVRETDASEKELEALALYMGHSIQMQRTSYDRRTLSTKVAPAVQLMKSVNNMEGEQ